MRYAPDIILLELNLEVNVTVTRKKYATLRDPKVHAHSIGYAPQIILAVSSEIAGDSRLAIANSLVTAGCQ